MTCNSYKYGVCGREQMSERLGFLYNKLHQKSHKTTWREIWCSEGQLTAGVSRTTGTTGIVCRFSQLSWFSQLLSLLSWLSQLLWLSFLSQLSLLSQLSWLSRLSQLSLLSLQMASNYSLLANHTEHCNRPFLPSATTLWNDISFDIRCLKSIAFTVCPVIKLLMILLLKDLNKCNFPLSFTFRHLCT